MTWQQTHARWQVLLQIEDALTADPLVPVWRAEHAPLFADAAALASYLRYRWRLRLEADGPTAVDDEHPARTVARVGLSALDLQEARRATAA